MADCSRCGAPLTSRDVDCRYCGRERDRPAQANEAPRLGWGVEILDVGENKIHVIKVLRQNLKLGLREAKDLAESRTPIQIKIEGSPALRLIKELKDAGANARPIK